jgi:hypothetical protein
MSIRIYSLNASFPDKKVIYVASSIKSPAKKKKKKSQTKKPPPEKDSPPSLSLSPSSFPSTLGKASSSSGIAALFDWKHSWKETTLTYFDQTLPRHLQVFPSLLQ